MTSAATAATAPAASGRRRGPLAWGQQEMWTAMRASAPDDARSTFCRVVEIPAGIRPVDRDRLDAALAAVVERHEGLRSRLVEIPGGWVQEVLDPAPVAVVEVAARAGGEPAAAERLAADLRATRFDYTGEPPLRVGAVRRGPGVSHVVLAFCHVAADGQASDLVVRDLLTLLRGRRPAGPVLQPLDLAAWQASEEGRAVAGAARRYWDAASARVPDPMFGGGAEPPPGTADQVVEARMVSPGLGMSLAELARRTRVSTHTILLAATAVLVGRQAGHDVVGLAPTAGNRVRPETTTTVTCVAQNGLFCLDVGAPHGPERFTELLPRAHTAALQAYRWAYHDPTDRTAGDHHPFAGFNDLRPRDRPGPVVGREAVRRALERTTLRSSVRPERLCCRFAVRVTDEPGGVGLEVRGDPRYVPPAFVAELGPDLEELVVSAVFAADGRP